MAGPQLSQVALDIRHMDGLLALSAEAGWNQVADDWAFMLANGAGYGFADADGRLVASGLTVEFPRYAWISMILVTPAWRRRGLATRLMKLCAERLASVGLPAGLDASPQGREVYLKLGFRDCGSTTRLEGELAGQSVPPMPYGLDVAPMTTSDIAEVAALDARSAGTDRTPLLAHLLARMPQAAFVAHRGGCVSGFVLARPGRQCAQIGPLVSSDEATAITLVASAGAAVGGPLCLDLFDERGSVRRYLDRCGFRPATTFVRMVSGARDLFPPDHHTMAMAGPELS